METLKKLIRRYWHYIIYTICGFITTFVNWGSYAVLTSVVGLDYRLSNVLSWIISVSVAFFTNRTFVFGGKGNVLGEMAKFFSARVFTGAIEIILLPALVGWGLDMDVLGVDNFVAKFIVTAISTILNYILSRFVVFKVRGSEGISTEPDELTVTSDGPETEE